MTRINLREERERRHITIKDVSYIAGIPVQFIEALETGIVPKKLRGPILLSYKKKYLKFLELPQDSKLRFRTSKQQLPPSKNRRNRTKTLLTTTTNGIKQPSTLQSMAVGFSLAICCIVVLKLISSIFDTPANATEPPPTTEKTSIEATDVAASVQTSWIDSLLQATIPEEGSEEQDSPPAEAAPPKDVATMTVYANENTKIQLHCDGALLYNGYLEKGSDNTQICEFTDKVSLWSKDVSRVRISFNDRLIRPMGPQDTARTFVFTR